LTFQLLGCLKGRGSVKELLTSGLPAFGLRVGSVG
jgi:hypothetical protein